MRPICQIQKIETNAGFASAIGNQDVLRARKMSLACSRRCTGDVILKTYDFARLVRGSGRVIVSGFHSPIEKDCLPILLRGPDPIIIVQAHRLSTTRLPLDWQKAIRAGRLLLLSPFDEKHKRVTADLAAQRNRFVAEIADEVLVPYAHPGSKTEALALDLLAAGKLVYTLNDRPSPLLDHGAKFVKPEFFSALATNAARKRAEV